MAISYKPCPIDTSSVILTEELLALCEVLAAHAHDLWAQQRLAAGWRWGEKRSDSSREHPCLTPYESLPETEKEYDRVAALGTLRAVLALGYQITRTVEVETAG
jgi:ryanodine receptor 2